MEVPDPNDASSPISPIKKKEDPLITTVFVAAPLVKNWRLGITGHDSNLGNWNTAKGEFELVHDIGNSYGNFQGHHSGSEKSRRAFQICILRS